MPIVITFIDYKGELQDLAFVQYSFECKEHSIDIQPHGNAKHKAGAFRRVKPSTVQMIKNEMLQNKRPVKVLEAVENKMGGVMHAQSSCDLPHDRRQVYNFKNAEKLKQESCVMAHGISRTDTLAHIMNTFKQENGINAFIAQLKLLLSLCVYLPQTSSLLILSVSALAMNPLFFLLIQLII